MGLAESHVPLKRSKNPPTRFLDNPPGMHRPGGNEATDANTHPEGVTVMKDVKVEQVNEISGGALPGTLGEIFENGLWPGNPGGTPPYNPDGPNPDGPLFPV